TPCVNEFLEKFDQFIIEDFNSKFLGKSLGSIFVTPETIQRMFKPSFSDEYNSFRINIDKTCTIFDSADSEGHNDITKPFSSKVNVIVEPAFLWAFDGKVGIRWNCKQVFNVPVKHIVTVCEPDHRGTVDNLMWASDGGDIITRTS